MTSMRSWGARRVGLVAASALAVGGSGCQTITDDLGGLSDLFLTPGEAAIMMIDQYDADNRYKGTVAISNSPGGGAEANVNYYRDQARYEENPLVRAVSIAALGRHGTAEDATTIARNLSHSHQHVRWEAAKALHRLHDPAVVADLLSALLDPEEDVDVRTAVAVALGQYRQERVFQALVKALDAIELAVNLAAGRSLAMLTGEGFGLDPRAWLQWHDRTSEPFANAQEYLYPTYDRPESWLEKLTFWSARPTESPGVPAGLEPMDRRRTYQDDDPDGETGG